MYLRLNELENTIHSDFEGYMFLQVGGGMNKSRLLDKATEIANLNFSKNSRYMI